jgi:hypothetical protein
VDGFTIKKIRRSARNIFEDLIPKSTRREDLPTGFPSLGLTATMQFQLRITALYPDLKLCSALWKSENVGIDIYPSWKKRRIRFLDRINKPRGSAGHKGKAAGKGKGKRRRSPSISEDDLPPSKATRTKIILDVKNLDTTPELTPIGQPWVNEVTMYTHMREVIRES